MDDTARKVRQLGNLGNRAASREPRRTAKAGEGGTGDRDERRGRASTSPRRQAGSLSARGQKGVGSVDPTYHSTKSAPDGG